MVITTEPGVTESQVDRIREWVEGAGLRTFLSSDSDCTVIGCLGDVPSGACASLRRLPGVADVRPVKRPYKLASGLFRAGLTRIQVGEALVGDGSPFVIAGPCSVEGRDMLMATARAVGRAGARAIRGGVFKPRTSPYGFRGLGRDGLEALAEVRDRVGLPVVTEVMSPKQVDVVCRYADVLQVGARNMQNYDLLLAVGRVRRPVLLKRGLSATVTELLLAAEYILSTGNPNVILCERGIRTFEPSTRNSLDLTSVPVLRRETHLPVLVDPSHAAGDRELVLPLAAAAIAAGADGLLVEVHPDPEHALTDGPQSLRPEQFSRLMTLISRVAGAVSMGSVVSTDDGQAVERPS